MNNDLDGLTATRAPGVRYASFANEDTGEVTPLYLRSHEAIDAELDQRVKLDKALGCADRARGHEATRVKFHTRLDGYQTLLAVPRALAKRHAREDHAREVASV